MDRELAITQRIQEIDEETNALSLEMASIKNQIENAKAKQQMEGIHSDKYWLSRAKHALRMKGATHQKLKVERGQLSRELKQVRGQRIDKTLMKVFYDMVVTEIGKERSSELFSKAVSEVRNAD